MKFKDAEFMTSKEKTLVLKQWKTFINHGFQEKHFTKRIYDHLILHCSFIAHFNKYGFYSTYFENYENKKRFINQFTNGVSCEMGGKGWLNGDYSDLNNEMCSFMRSKSDKLLSNCDDAIRQRDISFATQLLNKHGVAL